MAGALVFTPSVSGLDGHLTSPNKGGWISRPAKKAIPLRSIAFLAVTRPGGLSFYRQQFTPPSDKIDHIFYDGWKIYKLTEEQAKKESEDGENGKFGLEVDGIYCSADIYANMLGYKFYNELADAIKNDKPYTFKLTKEDLAKLKENKNPNKLSEEIKEIVDANKKKGNDK